MTISNIYIAAATNRFNQAADVLPESSDLIIFGSSRLLALWDVKSESDEGVFCTLPGSQSLITCVKFLQEDLFVSANDSGEIFLWKKGIDITQWNSCASAKAHSRAISTICALNNYLVTGSSESSVKIWKISESGSKNDFVETQTLDLNGKLPLISALSLLPQSTALLLAVGCTDNKVQLWVSNFENRFVHCATLTGHEDWIRSLAFNCPQAEHNPLVLASGSQDATIRLWNIEPRKHRYSNNATASVEELLDNFEASLGDLGENEEGGRQISLKHHIITVNELPGKPRQFTVTFDALLVGHEAGITSLSWRPNTVLSAPTLLSTSTDSSLILWSPSVFDQTKIGPSSIWINRQRFGDVGGQRFGGFLGGLWARDGTEALAWGWTGEWRRWRLSTPSIDFNDEIWTEVGAISGHNGPVRGLDWSPDGKYLISSSLDQTTRIHGPAQKEDTNFFSWHEIARPQVHGYDLLNVVFINPLRFASIADEKVVRVFEAPRGFIELTSRLRVAEFSEEEKRERPVAANVPPLGLSNKAISDGPQELTGQFDYTRRPFNGELNTMTLWPEVEKIFGHGYESMTLGVSNSRKLIATACKATNAEHAVVRVYDTEQYTLVEKPLQGHDLTVTRISFSPDDKHILTVSRDRSWRLFAVEEGSFRPIAAEKAHGRIIWDCAWSTEGDMFATASRDKSVKIWSQSNGKWTAVALIKVSNPITAVAFCPANEQGRRYLGMGLENGQILIYSAILPTEWRREEIIDSDVAHVDHIHRMMWRPSTTNPHELATCSEDGTLRIIGVQLASD